MTTQEPKNTAKTAEKTRRTSGGSSHVTEARSAAQRVKLDALAEAREQGAAEVKEAAALKKARGKKEQKPQGQLQANRRASTTIAHAVDDYLLDHEGGNHSTKTLEWHRTALGLMRAYFEEERGITLVGEVDAPDINAWFAHMRKSPGRHGKPRACVYHLCDWCAE
jgi:integrase/recombinase XerD